MPRTNWGHSFIVLKYPSVNIAMDALAIIHQLKHENEIELKDAVVVYRQEDGSTKMHQTVEPNAEQGAMLGIWLGLVAALYVAMAPLALVLSASLVMAMAFGRIDRGIDNRELLRRARDIKPGIGLLFLLVKKAHWSEVTSRMEPLQGETLTYNITPEAAEAFVEMDRRRRPRPRLQSR
ncbi:DUF1269 domain-containing protein [Chloroflexi bacterium TSY]|nr:DUF1269 domain-containing protein [Chloroflexi bacterium TSY]